MKDLMVKLVKETVEIPEFIKRYSYEKWELEKQLIDEKITDDESRTKARENVAYYERELEWLRHRQSAVITTVNLVTALTSAGRMGDIQSVLAVLEKNQKDSQKNQEEKIDTPITKNKENNSNEKKKNQDSNLETGIFTIKKVDPGKSEGTMWATAVAENGKIYKICARNGNGKTLLEATGKKTMIRYRPMDEGKLFGASVEIQK